MLTKLVEKVTWPNFIGIPHHPMDVTVNCQQDWTFTYTVKLDHSFRGPYHVYTPLLTHIRSINEPHDDIITVSLLRLFCCHSKQLDGHGRTQKHRELWRNTQTNHAQAVKNSESTEPSTFTTCRGRPIKKSKKILFIS